VDVRSHSRQKISRNQDQVSPETDNAKGKEAVILASQLRPGMAVRYEGRPYRVMLADYHPGQGKMGGVAHVRLKSLETGNLWEHSFRAELKLDDLPVEKRPMDYLYSDGDQHWFMDPESYEQVPFPASMIGEGAAFLEPEMRLTTEFVDGAPCGILFPDMIEVKVADTAPPVHQQHGVQIMVPQFIKTGDAIRLEIGSLKYVERARAAGK
jgi:elongation factor P